VRIAQGPGHASEIARAQASLGDACGDLDAALMSLTDIEGEAVMANAELVGLLLRVVVARRDLSTLERPRGACPPASLR
jgi:hypothetical protein